MQDIVFYAAANETLGVVRDYSNMNNASAPVLTLGVAVCLRIRLFADIRVTTPYPVASLNSITDWHWSMDADFDRSTACKLVADEGGISVHTVSDTINGNTMSFTEFVIPISNMNTEELAAWLGNDGTKSGLTGELVGYDGEGHAVFVLQIEGFKVRNRVAGLSDPAAVDEGFVTRIIADSMIQTAVSASAAAKQDKLTAGTGITITGGTHVSISLAAGERMAVISGSTIGQKRYFPITNITGNTVTLAAGSAYRMNATTGTKTLYAENMTDDTFGLEGHIEIFVANAGNIQTGKLAGGTTEVILADALEPDAVNNCTVRFHDHKAIISVEDHVAGHIVTLAGGTYTTEEGTLYYWLMQPNTASDAATQYIGFDARTNNTPVNFEGAANTAVKHVVGNGYTQTLLTGNVAPAAALTVSDLGLQNVTVTGGTLTLGDAFIPSGSTVSAAGGSVMLEHADIDGTLNCSGGVMFAKGAKIEGSGLIDLAGFELQIKSAGYSFDVSGVTIANGNGAVFTSGYNTRNTYTSCTFLNNVRNHDGAAIAQNRGELIVTDCIFSGNYGGYRGGAISMAGDDTTVGFTVTGCTITGNSAYVAGGLGAGDKPFNVISSIVSGNISDNNRHPFDVIGVGNAKLSFSACTLGELAVSAGGTITFLGSNSVDNIVSSGGAVVISSGASIAITDAINPGGSITFSSGGATVLYSSGVVSGSYMMDNVTLPAGAKLTNTAVVDLGGTRLFVLRNETVDVSGCTFTNGLSSQGGAMFISSYATANMNRVSFVNNSATNAGGALGGYYGTYNLTSCVFSGNTAGSLLNGNAAEVGAGVNMNISACEFDVNQSIRTISSGTVTFIGSNTLKSRVTGSGTVTLTSGAILDLTGNTNATPIAPGGGITIPAGAVVKIIGSDGPTSSAYLSELALTGTTITNVPSVLGATVTVPATGGPWEVLFADSTSSTYSATGTERQEVLAGAVTYIGGQ